MVVKQKDPLLKCLYLVSYDSSEINLFKRTGANSFSLTLNLPCDQAQCFPKLVSILNDLPINSAVCVIVGKAMSRVRPLKNSSKTSVVLDTDKNLSVILIDKDKKDSVKFDIARNDIGSLISKLEESTVKLKLSVMLRAPSIGFPYSIFIELNSRENSDKSLASRISCYRNTGILMFYSKGIIGSGLEKSVYVPLELISGSFAKHQITSTMRKIRLKPIYIDRLKSFKSTMADVALKVRPNFKTSRRKNDTFKSVSKNKIDVLKLMGEFFAGLLKRKPEISAVDVIVVCDDSAQTACCTAMTIKNSFTSDCVIELGAYRERMRSNFSQFFGAVMVVETNNLPLTMDDAQAAVGQLVQKTNANNILTLVVGSELLRNASFSKLITALFVNYRIRSISFFGHDSILVDDETIGLMKDKSDRITFVICGKKERLSSIQAFHKGVRVIELPNINVANITESDRELIRVDIFS